VHAYRFGAANDTVPEVFGGSVLVFLMRRGLVVGHLGASVDARFQAPVDQITIVARRPRCRGLT
jgi:hypothetical protein